jgi:hypothetical protein
MNSFEALAVFRSNEILLTRQLFGLALTFEKLFDHTSHLNYVDADRVGERWHHL